MTFLETLQSHRGGLIRLKSELYWYDRVSWDENPGQICLLLDAAENGGAANAAASRTAIMLAGCTATVTDAYLLIDGSPHWIWTVAEDVEFL